MKKEELEAVAERAARRQQMVNEIEINVFLREQRNRAMVEETENEPGQENVDESSEDSQVQNQSQDREDLEYEYVTSHDELAYKVNEGKTTPRLVSYEVESEVESERAISPLYEECYEEVVLDEWPPEVKEEVVEEEVEEEEVVQDDAQQTPPRTVIFEETIRNTPVQERVGLKNSEKREAQRTKPAKERLGTKPSDFRPAHDGLGKQVPRTNVSHKDTER